MRRLLFLFLISSSLFSQVEKTTDFFSEKLVTNEFNSTLKDFFAKKDYSDSIMVEDLFSFFIKLNSQERDYLIAEMRSIKATNLFEDLNVPYLNHNSENPNSKPMINLKKDNGKGQSRVYNSLVLLDFYLDVDPELKSLEEIMHLYKNRNDYFDHEMEELASFAPPRSHIKRIEYRVHFSTLVDNYDLPVEENQQKSTKDSLEKTSTKPTEKVAKKVNNTEGDELWNELNSTFGFLPNPYQNKLGFFLDLSGSMNTWDTLNYMLSVFDIYLTMVEKAIRTGMMDDFYLYIVTSTQEEIGPYSIKGVEDLHKIKKIKNKLSRLNIEDTSYGSFLIDSQGKNYQKNIFDLIRDKKIEDIYVYSDIMFNHELNETKSVYQKIFQANQIIHFQVPYSEYPEYDTLRNMHIFQEESETEASNIITQYVDLNMPRYSFNKKRKEIIKIAKKIKKF
ncbi:hypothetical protein N9N67_04665 [Bacteriovoracaceae bacterium]|nr:hypothetical protein [Bacteriovoracaceae bacterium]